ncbi:outer membrane beta-barrel family protein [Aridibaculum aurantiacum]|uniref:outer membrane beta-barrel family protein n=1 Tax=Aridibaculum aurantiacum TaxID=2810307 RepID=UPI001A95E3BE|nr:outer membrane beta-barrel family protein [Aridibaculum aurantiacum]
MKNIMLPILLLIATASLAQMPGGRGMGMGQNMNVGHLYGKIVNSKTNKGIDGASIQLMGNRFDSATRKMVPATIRAMVTASNGDFSMDNLPVMGNFTLKVSAIGFKASEQKVSFGLRPPGQGGQGGGGMEAMMSMVDKDLGNIKLEEDAANLGNVTVTSTSRLFEMGVDRKVFNVDKNLTSVGQTATEVMRNIPSISVDIDGNVTLRNAAPQLFVDGRPTTLTLDQIPADIIDKVELITNPSAKFDASGGNAGILNIVLKKNRKVGYNGGVRTGIDSRGMVNLGADLNLRQNKVNFFLNGMLNQRKSLSWTDNDRTNLNNPVRILQDGQGINKGAFGFIRGGFDYFIDNRNTLSFSGNYNRGSFDNTSDQRIDSIVNSIFKSYNQVDLVSNFNMRNYGSQISFKHLFAKPGHEWTADANYNSNNNSNTSLIDTRTFRANETTRQVLQQSIGGGKTNNYVFQTDYVNPIGDNKKMEFGGRVAIRDFENDLNQSFFNFNTGKYEISPNITNRYKFTDKVYAAYGNYSFKVNKWSYQLGLRVESSDYDGTLKLKSVSGLDSNLNFKVKFPVSLFPSAFITYRLSDKEDLQANYSRRINRPNFFQLMPFINFSDPQNISVGNAGLKPEFTNSLELSYNNSYKRGANFLANAFFKHNTNLITRFQYVGVNPDTAGYYSTSDSLPYNTFVNANTGFTYGIELTNRVPVTTWWDNTINFNLFNSKINLSDAQQGNLTNQRTSWFVKLNNNFKLPKNYSIQFSGDYYARTVLPQEGGRGGGRGGGMFGSPNIGTAQGYINPRYSFDIAIRKDWTWKGGNSASLTLSMNDIFRTQIYSTYSVSPILVQTTEQRRDPQVARLNFSYRFGKFDVNLLRRKNTRADQGGGDMMMQ